ILAEAVEIASSAERQAFVDKACAGNEQLRRQVERLIANHLQAGSFLESPAGLPSPLGGEGHRVRGLATLDEPIREVPGTVIGPYKLLEQIGEGGFGVVFMAEQQQPVRRRVALKVLKPGMDTRQVVARFEAERQALALMDHPNIAHVFDGGATESGRPYFVMELGKGIRITDYCDQHQLTPRQRLELFIPVCQAVQHAHQKGIIHRDIKPSNVMVTLHDGVPVVKVIDFGIAKATGPQLTDKTLFTNFAQLIGTPLYMSPEQAGLSGLDVDTRSDIYSLGVVLYELLTGTTPFDKERFKEADYDEIRRIIREEEPPKPSTRIDTLGQAASTIAIHRHSDPRHLRQLCRGELDWIVMKCLEKDRNRRYETASGLARDIERYLHDEPVQACPPSAWYRFRKFARRNRAGLALSGLVLFFTVLLGGGFGWFLRDQTVRQEQATLEARAARADVAQLQREGKWTAALAVARRAETLLASGGANPELRRELAELARDLEMAAELEEIRLRKTDVKDGHFDWERAASEYAAAFRAFGIDVETPEPTAAEQIRARSISAELAAALDDWAGLPGAKDKEGRKRLRALAAAADPDPFRNRLREAFERPDRKVLEELAASEQFGNLPPSSVVLLADALMKAKARKSALELL